MGDNFEVQWFERVKVRRLELNISKKELAEALGYASRTSIAKIEAGINDLPQSKIEALAEALDTTPGYIMGWDDEILNNARLDVRKMFDNDPEKIRKFYKGEEEDQARESAEADIKFAVFGDPNVTDAQYDEIKQFAKWIRERDRK
jgi:transcriptional regulator with XRE-family HTH domain